MSSLQKTARAERAARRAAEKDADTPRATSAWSDFSSPDPAHSTDIAMQAVQAGLAAIQPCQLPPHHVPDPPPPFTEREQHLERQLLAASEQYQQAATHVHQVEQKARGLEEQMEEQNRQLEMMR
jgi:hypothetical protein